MGIDITNVELRPHTPGARTYATYYWWLHQQSISVETQSPSECSKADRDGMCAAAAQSQSAFDSAVGAIWPTWYAGIDSTWRARMRAHAAQVG